MQFSYTLLLSLALLIASLGQTKAQKHNRKRAIKYYKTGKYHLKNYNFREAEVYLTRALKNDSTYLSIYKLRYKASYHSHKYKQAAFDFHQLLQQSTNQNGTFWFYKGINCFELEHYEQSIADLQTSRAMGYKSPLLNAYLAEGYICTKQYDEALVQFRQALLIAPNEPKLLLGRAKAYYYMGKYPQSIANSKKVIALDPFYKSDCLHLQAMAYFALEDYKKALKKFEEFIKLHKEVIDNNTLNVIAFCFAHQKDLSQAIKYSEMLIKGDPDESWWYYDIANYQLQANDLVNALEMNTKAISIEPTLSIYHLQRGKILHQKGEYSKAIKELDNLIQQEPNGEAYYQRALSKHAHKKSKKYIKPDLRKALELEFPKEKMSTKMKDILHKKSFLQKIFPNKLSNKKSNSKK